MKLYNKRIKMRVVTHTVEHVHAKKKHNTRKGTSSRLFIISGTSVIKH